MSKLTDSENLNNNDFLKFEKQSSIFELNKEFKFQKFVNIGSIQNSENR